MGHLVKAIDFKYIQSNLALMNCLIRNKLILRNHFLWPICRLLHKDKELLALRNNVWATKKFLVAKFDCNMINMNNIKTINYLLKVELVVDLQQHEKKKLRLLWTILWKSFQIHLACLKLWEKLRKELPMWLWHSR